MDLSSFLALPVGSRVTVKKSGKVYQLLSVTVRPQRDIETGLNEEYYALGRGLAFRQLRDGKLYGPFSRLKAANVEVIA